VICPRHQAEYGEYCAGCLLDERDLLIDRLRDAGCPETRPELRKRSIRTLRAMTGHWEHKKRAGK
jgi:hypothetical protein